jgi:hypothetical protein
MTSPSASNFGANARPSSTSSAEPRCAKGKSSSDKKNLAKIVVGRAGGRSSNRSACQTRAAHYIELLRVRTALPARGMISAAVLAGSATAAQRSAPRTMVMKRT